MSKVKSLIFAAVAVVVIAISWWVMTTHDSTASVQETNDAYVRAHMTQIVPMIAGRVEALPVEDYQAVKQGDLLLVVEDSEQQQAVAAAKAQVSAAKARLHKLAAQLDNQDNRIAIAANKVDAAEARLAVANADATRFSNMAKDGSGSRQDKEQAESAKISAQADVNSARLSLEAEQDTVSILKAQQEEAKAALDLAKAQLDEAQIQLGYTRINAPIDGIVAQRTARKGGYIRPGQATMTLVPAKDLYVEAHFRETQVANMRVGDSVTLTFDSLPGKTFTGEVASFGPATGVSYSPVQPVNASGNFTKIVQRLPVRIKFTGAENELTRLKVGMSAVVKVAI